ncbi:LuxR C-terminal-related transcriptional regulator [Treponema sp.]|uniref:LuxR C-terminal-related transcriptional regulator n=1 Tax=Treponema sp. TaxID=166 RepID=UPI00388DC383
MSEFYTPEELYNKMTGISKNYFLINVRRDRESYYKFTDEQLLSTSPALLLAGKVLNLIMDGELKKAWDTINLLSENEINTKIMKLALTNVHPEVTLKQFITNLDEFKRIGIPITSVMLTAGRPSILNGVNDFSRIAVLLPRNRDTFLGYLKWMYPENLCPFVYNLCLAEYYYQQNKLIDAQMLASTTLKNFDIEGERRIMFSALYLRSKILLATGNTVSSESFITDIRNLVKEDGNAEFSYNIDAAQVHFALYEGKMDVVNRWLLTDAPDEYADFNMLDLYRYMIKMRCYIVTKHYASVIPLAEKIRPLADPGKRWMDLCELDLLLAMSLYLSENKTLAFETLSRALKIAKLHRYYRLIADEGSVMLNLLIDYIKEKGSTDFLMNLVEMTRTSAIRHPLYLTHPKTGDTNFTKIQLDILRLLEQGKTKEEIADIFFISVNTVKFHLHKIYTKLGVSKPHQAVWQARVTGLLPPSML